MPTGFSSHERAATSRLGKPRDESDTDDTPNIRVVSEPDLPPATSKAIEGWIPTSSRSEFQHSPSSSLRGLSYHTHSSALSLSLSAQLALGEDAPEFDPPEYSIGADGRKSGSTLYTFTPTAGNAVTLLPPLGTSDELPRFHIVVNQNVFNPLVHCTTVYRGEVEAGNRVGCFELGISNIPGRVRIHGKDTPIKTMLVKSGTRETGYWMWIPPYERSSHLSWYYGVTPAICKTRNHDAGIVVLAKYTPAKWLTIPKKSGSVEEEESFSMLEVTPRGQELFEDVLISLLIIERKRMIPARDSHTKPLFN
ncbi:hypothetical protein NLJ89_g3425 [Agrocybe chaxingu]|uniref:Uncharacterized protein n=1 Tax=Agrocybe chaxingu TaxID=84603 RepID=A0A9W8K2I2_9AGAR|nr:hypothetical protein NLJ89_g3425 [Agrocybe chaxingu]